MVSGTGNSFKRIGQWLLVDGIIVLTSLALGCAVRSVSAHIDIQAEVTFAMLAVIFFWLTNAFFRLYHRIWRYASAGEVSVIVASVGVASTLLLIADLAWPQARPLPISVIPMTGLFSCIGFIGVRYRRRLWIGLQWRRRSMIKFTPASRCRVIIYGAGEAGQILAWRLLNEKPGRSYLPVGFIDDALDKIGLRVHGLPVLGNRDSIPLLVTTHKIDMIIIAIHNLAGPDMQAILDICEPTSAAIKVIPNVFEFLQGDLGKGYVRDIVASDLLGRKPAEINQNGCRELLVGKRVLVTGAAGSIGSELCCQIASFEPDQLIVVDNNETGIHDLFIDLDREGVSYGFGEESGCHRVVPIVADVTNETKLRSVFATYRPQVVFHAAAYKHVPLMELHPDEAVRVNVLGTAITAKLASAYGAERFVMVSTDKAINPESIMGATKRVAEMIIGMVAGSGSGNGTADNGQLDLTRVLGNTPAGPTVFTAVRFGNVLGSRGSVVPTFERQIDQGGPVTVTHPDMTRYLMSIPEAVSLIIQAATLTEGSDVFMLDMGKSIRIDELARRLIRMRGLRPDIDIPIVYTGTRPGEKMHEELLGNKEDQCLTVHPRIVRIIGCYQNSVFAFKERLDRLVALSEAGDNAALVELLWQIVRVEDKPLPKDGSVVFSASSEG